MDINNVNNATLLLEYLPHHDRLEFFGSSVAGMSTTIYIPQLNVCFDMATFTSENMKAKTVCVSHGHTDHIGALHHHFLLRLRHQMKGTTYYVPKECIEALNQACLGYYIMNYGEKESIKLPSLITEGDVELKPNFFVRSYPVIHRVPCLAYCIFHKSMVIKEEYIEFCKQSTKAEIKAKKKELNVGLREERVSPYIAYSGDTTIEGVLQHDDLLNAHILFIECTYIHTSTDNISPQQAKDRGHIHSLDIKQNSSKFNNSYIVLTHFSQRYTDDIIYKCARDIEKTFKGRIKVKIFR